MKPNIWPKLNEIHQRWLTNEATVGMIHEMVMAIKSESREMLRNISNEKVNGTSFHSLKRNRSNFLNSSFNSNSGFNSPRPQTPPTNLHPAKSPRSPRRTLSIDYKKEVIQTRSTPNSSIDGENRKNFIEEIEITTTIVTNESPTIKQHKTATSIVINKENQKKSPRSTSTSSTTAPSISQPTIKPNTILPIPRFYYSKGKPTGYKDIEITLASIREKLVKLTQEGGIPRTKLAEVIKIVNLPYYWKQPFYLCCGGRENRPLKLDDIINSMKIMLSNCGTDESKFMYIMTKGGLRNFLERSDFEPLLRDVLETHPGLQFLQTSIDFHIHYINTVIARIFYNIDRNWDDRITLSELNRSDLLWVLSYLEKHSDINMVTQYFSYEHFYVIYCKFWELDDDHNLIISRDDLLRHNNYAMSERILDRVFSGTVLRKPANDKTMHYPEFVWFLLAEEDKQHPRSIEYWFRLMDLDGDGALSMYELEYFYEEQLQKMEDRGIEPVNFQDCLCMMLDAVKPKNRNKILLSDLKCCKLTSIFFNTFFNLQKYLEHEQGDPFNNLRDIEEGLTELSDWDRFASDTYEQLMMEDSQQQMIGSSNEFVYEDEDIEEPTMGFHTKTAMEKEFDRDIDKKSDLESASSRLGLIYVDRN